MTLAVQEPLLAAAQKLIDHREVQFLPEKIVTIQELVERIERYTPDPQSVYASERDRFVASASSAFTRLRNASYQGQDVLVSALNLAIRDCVDAALCSAGAIAGAGKIIEAYGDQSSLKISFNILNGIQRNCLTEWARGHQLTWNYRQQTAKIVLGEIICLSTGGSAQRVLFANTLKQFPRDMFAYALQRTLGLFRQPTL